MKGVEMIGTNGEEKSLRAYLLGKVPEDEQLEIEKRLLLDRDYMESLLIIEEELIDSYLQNTLSEREREEFQNYFLTTPARRRKLRMAKALRRYINNQQPIPASGPRVRESRSNRFWRWPVLTPAWQSAIAAMLVLGVGLTIWRNLLSESLTDKGRAALQAALRESPIEGRLANFNWPPQQVTLGEQSGNIADKTSLASAERYLLDAATSHPGPDSYYALGQLYMAKREIDNAIEQFGKALEGDPQNARLRNDLGAALLQRARASQEKGADSSLQDFDQSLEHLNQALALDDSLLAALFNRALCHEYMLVLSQAEADWQTYLKRDSSSAWAAEAERHLKEIEEKKQKASQINADLLQQFLAAYRAGDHENAWKLINGTREVVTGRLIWWQLLDDFFDLTAASRLDEANERVRALQYAGGLELNQGNDTTRHSRDPYLSELGEFYGSLSTQQQASAAQAHRLMNEGNKLYRAARYDEALGNYSQAKETFARIRNQGEAILAKLLIGYCHIQKGEMDRSRPLFEQIIEECRERGYVWLLAQSSFSLAMVQDRSAEYSKALENTRQALRISKEMSDAYNTQKSLAQIADQYRKLGNYELATSYLNRCLEQINVAWPGSRQMWRNCDQLMQVLTARRLNAAAATYADEALRLALETNDSSIVYVSYIHSALLRSKQQNYTEAIRLAQLGLNAAPDGISSAYASLQLGHLRRQMGDLRQALSDYDRSINDIDSIKPVAVVDTDDDAGHAKTDRLPALRYDAHKGKLFCFFAQGDDISAQEELKLTLELLERNRGSIREEKNRNTFFNVEQTVYDAAIAFEQSRRSDNPSVFNYSEESRARSLLDMISLTRNARVMRLDEVQPRLPDQTLLIEYIVLDNKLLICVVSKSEFVVKEVQVTLSELTDKVLNFRRSILRHTTEPLAEAQELYDLLIKPLNLSTENRNKICIVPDKVLNNLPFAALISPASGGYLVEDYVLTVSPSATIFLACSERTYQRVGTDQERLFAVGDPSFDRSAFPQLPALPTTRQQVEKIAKLYHYRPSLVLTGDDAREELVKRKMEEADVIHLASHYVVYEGDPMNSRLLLAQEPRGRSESDTSAGFLQADEVYGLKLRHAPLVILSACESGVEHYYNGEGMIGMSRVFIAAGAPVVVASLWKVDAYATDDLMVNFHKHRKLEGLSTSEALRFAQKDMLKSTSKNHPYYWAGFTAIGGQTYF
jgi:CHAT domain-containing protein/Flp pilus assembly protein TadD